MCIGHNYVVITKRGEIKKVKKGTGLRKRADDVLELTKTYVHTKRNGDGESLVS